MHMGLSLGMQMRCEVHQALMVRGGATSTVFPQVEAWLYDDNNRQKALEYVASRKKMERYKSMVDFLFCEIFTHFRGKCMKYYAGKGPKLREFITVEQLIFFNDALLKGLELAYSAFTDQRLMSWTRFRSKVLALAA